MSQVVRRRISIRARPFALAQGDTRTTLVNRLISEFSRFFPKEPQRFDGRAIVDRKQNRRLA